MRELELAPSQLPQSLPVSRVLPGRSVIDFRGQQFVDASAVEIDDLEAPTFHLNVIADVRYPAEVVEQEACTVW